MRHLGLIFNLSEIFLGHTDERGSFNSEKKKKIRKAKGWSTAGSSLSLAEDELNSLIVFSICISSGPTVSKRDSDPADLSGWG